MLVCLEDADFVVWELDTVSNGIRVSYGDTIIAVAIHNPKVKRINPANQNRHHQWIECILHVREPLDERELVLNPAAFILSLLLGLLEFGVRGAFFEGNL
jgi:hypothetical protein